MKPNPMPGSPWPPENYAGFVRLFPLPDLVMFPHVVQPLRVFEPRYIAMFEDALKDDTLITTALLRPGWEANYEGQPDIYSAVCVGRILSYVRQPDGSYNLLLAGLVRGRIRSELALLRPYRRAEIEWLPDQETELNDDLSSELRASLLKSLAQVNPRGLGAVPEIQQHLSNQVPLGVLTDVIAYAAPLNLIDKQSLLAEPSVPHRVRILVQRCRELSGSAAVRSPISFPQSFSDN
jgi:ATP-dependent Lon protease